MAHYVLFPALLLWLSRKSSANLLNVVLGIGVASFLFSIWAVDATPGAAFYLLPSRAWELMVGSGLALALLQGRLRPPGKVLREAAGGIGLLFILCAVFTFDAYTPFPGPAALLPCVGTGLLIYAGVGGERYVIGRLLGLRALVFIGLLSYSLYLWHWPVIVFLKHYLLEPLDVRTMSAAIVASFALAYLSWRFVERPFRKSTGQMFSEGWGWLRIEDTHLFRVTGAVMALAIAIGLILDQGDGLPARLHGEAAAIYAISEDKAPERKRCEGIAPQDVSYERLCRLVDNEVAPSFLVWGDSHGVAMMHTVGAAAQALQLNGLNATSNGCVPLLDLTRPARDLDATCIGFAQRIIDILAQHPQLQTVILISRWARHAEGTAYGEEGKPTLLLRHVDGRQASTQQENRALFAEGFATTLAKLHALQRRVVVIGPVPEIGVDVPSIMAKAAMRGRQLLPGVPRQAFLQRQAFVLQQMDRSDLSFEYRPVHEYFCDAQNCPAHDGVLPIYFDDNHPALRGSERLQPLFAEVLKPAKP
ncbi:MAG: acyltransferase family protein [Pseudomonadota bacterium]